MHQYHQKLNTIDDNSARNLRSLTINRHQTQPRHLTPEWSATKVSFSHVSKHNVLQITIQTSTIKHVLQLLLIRWSKKKNLKLTFV